MSIFNFHNLKTLQLLKNCNFSTLKYWNLATFQLLNSVNFQLRNIETQKLCNNKVYSCATFMTMPGSKVWVSSYCHRAKKLITRLNLVQLRQTISLTWTFFNLIICKSANFLTLIVSLKHFATFQTFNSICSFGTLHLWYCASLAVYNYATMSLCNFFFEWGDLIILRCQI